jgi:putative transposase
VFSVRARRLVEEERLGQEKLQQAEARPFADAAAMLFWALLASGQINMRKVDGWQSLTTNPIHQPIDLAA